MGRGEGKKIGEYARNGIKRMRGRGRVKHGWCNGGAGIEGRKEREGIAVTHYIARVVGVGSPTRLPRLLRDGWVASACPPAGASGCGAN